MFLAIINNVFLKIHVVEQVFKKNPNKTQVQPFLKLLLNALINLLASSNTAEPLD